MNESLLNFVYNTIQRYLRRYCHHNCKVKWHMGPEQCKQIFFIFFYILVVFFTPSLTGRLVMLGVNKSHYMILFTVQYSMIARCHCNCKLKRHMGPEQCKQVTCVDYVRANPNSDGDYFFFFFTVCDFDWCFILIRISRLARRCVSRINQ